MHILDTDVNNRISKQAFAEAYEASLHNTKDTLLHGQSGSVWRLPRPSILTKSFAPIFPMNDGKQESQKISGKSVSDYLSSLCQALQQQSDRIAELQTQQSDRIAELQTQQSDRIAELQTQQRHSMMQLQEVMKKMSSS